MLRISACPVEEQYASERFTRCGLEQTLIETSLRNPLRGPDKDLNELMITMRGGVVESWLVKSRICTYSSISKAEQNTNT